MRYLIESVFWLTWQEFNTYQIIMNDFKKKYFQCLNCKRKADFWWKIGHVFFRHVKYLEWLSKKKIFKIYLQIILEKNCNVAFYDATCIYGRVCFFSTNGEMSKIYIKLFGFRYWFWQGFWFGRVLAKNIHWICSIENSQSQKC